MDLVCAAGSLPALKAAVDNGADCVYIGFRDDTNARNFAGLNFDPGGAREGVRYAHARKRQVFLALNTYPQLAGRERAQQAVDRAAELEVDAVIIADAGLMQYTAAAHPQLRLHLSVQGSATNYEAINFFHRHFSIKRAVHLLAGKAPFVAGLHLNVYNPQTLALLAKLGARRWVMPVELSRESLRALQQHRPAAMATEIFGYGRLPLAFSARCFTARRYNLSKDSCEFRCLDHPDGMPLATREGQPFLAFNGIQTQSAQTYNLIHELAELSQLGVDVLRISPQSANTFTIVELFRQCLERSITPDLAARQMENLMPAAACNGYWHGQPGLEQVVASTPSVEA